MNIKGVGIDVVNVERILATLERYPERFKEKVFTEREYEYALSRAKGSQEMMALMLASRWAGKEAVAKALGQGFGKGLYWKSIEILSTGTAPQVVLHDVPEDIKKHKFLISLSHDYPTATAIAMLVE